jgi:hypothetical protein
MYLLLFSIPSIPKKNFPENLVIPPHISFTRKILPFEGEDDPVVYVSDSHFIIPEMKENIKLYIKSNFFAALVSSSLIRISGRNPFTLPMQSLLK